MRCRSAVRRSTARKTRNPSSVTKPECDAAGYKFALLPVALNSAALVMFGLFFHKLTGHRYPHADVAAPNKNSAQEITPSASLNFETQDIDAVLAEKGEVFDISREDLEELLRQI